MDNENSNQPETTLPVTNTPDNSPATSAPVPANPTSSIPPASWTPDTNSVPVVASPPSPPDQTPPPVSSVHTTNSPYKTFIIIGIVLTILASVGIAVTAIGAYVNKTKNTQNQVMNENNVPTSVPQNNIVSITPMPSEMVKDVVLTEEDPTRPGVPVEKKEEFSKKTSTIYVTVVLNNPVVGSKVSYVRYLDSQYVDNGTVVLTKENSKYVHFSFSLANQKASHPLGSYQLKIYVDGQLAKTIGYTVTN